MNSLVTIVIPIYKRLNYLPGVLAALRAQDYPNIELIVSDNGVNGDAVPMIVDAHYDRPYRFRQNLETVTISTHFNQLIEAATGTYFVLLADDDEISPNFVSTLVRQLEINPQVAVALPRVDVMDVAGNDMPRNEQRTPPPPLMTGREFIRIWCRDEYGFVSFATHMARTAEVRAAGGYPDFPSGNSNDNALLAKLILGRLVAYCPGCVFRYRLYETSTGLAAGARTLAEASRQFLHFLNSDQDIRRFIKTNPEEGIEARELLSYLTWMTYFGRWNTMYRNRMSRSEWIAAGFAMPWIPRYYRLVLSEIARSFPPVAALLSLRKRRLQQV